MRGRRRLLRLLGTPLSSPLPHFLVRFVRRATSHAAHDRPKHTVTMVKMACNAPDDCASNTAFGDSSARGNRNREAHE